MPKWKQWGLLFLAVIASLAALPREMIPSIKEENDAKLKLEVFQTPLTTPQSVLQNAFPRNWNPCTIKKKQQSLHISILGGSTSARPANDCLPHGRYSDILQHSVRLIQPLKMSNMAQGATNSQWSAFSLDELVDPLTTDILVWEYQVNDHWARGKPQGRSLQLWLARVEALYRQVQRPPPPICMVFFWDGYIAEHKNVDGFKGGLEEALPYVDYYRQNHGWNIQVVAVGAAILPEAFLHNPKLLIDDNHHPSCTAAHLIAHLLEYAIQQNWDTPCHSDSTINSIDASDTSIGIPQDDFSDLSEPWVREVWTLLLSTNVRVGSHTSWRPKLDGHSNLHISNLDSFAVHDGSQGKADNGRADRKFFYSIPECSRPNRMTIVIEGPDLEWLGFGGDKLYLLQLEINQQLVAWRSHRDFAQKLEVLDIQRWVNIPQDLTRASIYRIALCHKESPGKKKGLLNKIVAIMKD